MTWPLLLLALYLPFRVGVSLDLAARAWGHEPDEFRALAVVEAGPSMDPNPRRAASIDVRRRRWGPVATATTYPWRICSLMQLRGGMSGAGGFELPPCWLLVKFPELSAWYGAMHLAGWRDACGAGVMYEAYNTGECRYGVPRPFQEKVMRSRRNYACHLSNGRDISPCDDEVYWFACGVGEYDESRCLLHGGWPWW